MATATMGMDGSFEVTGSGRLRDAVADEDQRNYAVFTHLTVLVHMILPVVAVIIPIVMWLTRRESSRFIDDHGREAVNFHISLILWSVLMGIASVTVIPILGILTLGIALALWAPAALLPSALGVWGMIRAIQAAVRGEYVRYPMTWRFIKEPASA